MQRSASFFSAILVLSISAQAQVFSPIGTTGYNLDAVAENTPAINNTSGALDGSNYVMYSKAYGVMVASTYGLPNNGIVTSGTRTYQLQPYNQNNVNYVPQGMTDSLIITNPAPYSAISLLGFSTEGAGMLNVTLRFTDNSTQVLTSQSIPDWFFGATPIMQGFDRANRTTGAPDFQNGQPKIFNLDIVLPCVNRLKNLSRVIIQNTGAGSRICTMALSGAAIPTFSVITSPVTCAGGTNGSATLTGSGGVPPYAFATSGPPIQFGPNPGNLPVGVYTYSAADVIPCGFTATFAITQSLQPQPPLFTSSNFYTLCSGSSAIISVSGANTYTWSNNSSLQTITVTPQTTTTYTVAGTTSVNCLLTGWVVINVNPSPTVTLLPINQNHCTNSPCVPLSGSPPGGNYFGPGVNSGTFCPSTSGTGSITLSYSYIDPNNCSGTSTISVNVFSLAAPVISALSPSCINAASFQVQATPPGGVFNGTGISPSGIYSPTLAGAGTNTIGYTIISGPCVVSSVANIVINPLPAVSFNLNKSLFCTNAPKMALIGSPPTGTFSGPGVNSSVFTPSAAGIGIHTITLTYTDLNLCTNSAVNTVTVSTCESISEYSTNDVKIFPNPNNGSFFISLSTCAYDLFSATGALVREGSCNDENCMVTIDNLAEGVYVLRTSQPAGIRFQKIIVTR